MRTTTLRKVGGSVMLAVPPALLEQLQLQAGVRVGLVIDQGRLVVEAHPRPRYTLEQLLAESSVPASPRDAQWLDAPPVGGELL